MIDLTLTTVPKSDQLNADDLIGGKTLTITITRVASKGVSNDQPVSIYYESDPDGKRPYKPCKTMIRVMVECWGNDASKYVGRQMTLYRDPDTVYAGQKVGGIRISHLSHLSGDKTIAVTVTKQRRATYTVKALPGNWDQIEAPKQSRPKRDWKAELEAAQTIEQLGQVWLSMGKADREQFVAVKDARKQELELAAQKGIET